MRGWRRSSGCTSARRPVRAGWLRRSCGRSKTAIADLGYERARLDTGPKQPHAQRLYRAAGYVEIAPYNDNPFACFWGEKRLTEM